MRAEIILLCFLPIFLNLYKSTNAVFLNFSKSNANYCNTLRAYIIGRNVSSITIRLVVGCCFTEQLGGIVVRYKAHPPVVEPARMDRISTGHFTIIPPLSFHDNGQIGSPEVRFTPKKYGEETFTISNLRYPNSKYEFVIELYWKDEAESINTIVLKANTTSVIPSRPPITGVGCFRVTKTESSSRKVWIYWKQVYERGNMYKVTVYQDRVAELEEKYSRTNCLGNASVGLDLTLGRHRLVLSSYNHHGYSINSSFIIPAQQDIIPTITLNHKEDWEKGTIELSWEAPENVNVTNYTIAWLDPDVGWVDGKMQEYVYINDFVVVDNNTKNVTIKKSDKRRGALFALSVNTETGSSGLSFPIHHLDQSTMQDYIESLCYN